MKTLSKLPEAGGRRQAGFTTLELIGMLAVVVLLSATVAQHVFNRLRDEARNAEQQSLEGMAEALKSHILETRTVPAVDQLDEFIAEELERPVQEVRENPTGFARRFLYDPAFRIGEDEDAVPPYTQGPAGSIEPISPRVIILSRLDQAIPQQLAFNTLWALEKGKLPQGWTGNGEDLFVQRIDLRSLFHRVVLASTDGVNEGPYDVAGSAVQTVAPLARTETWLLDGTPLGFYYASTDLQAREFLREDVSYTFEVGRWTRHAVYGAGGWHAPFGQLVDTFMSAATPAENVSKTTPEDIAEAFYDYLYEAGMWALGDPDSGVEGFFVSSQPGAPLAPRYVKVWDAQRRLAQFTKNLVSNGAP